MREADVQAAFVRYLETEGWSVTLGHRSFVDVIADRGTEHLLAEVKGTTTSPGLDVDTLYGQLLRRIDPEHPTTRYAVVVPTHLVRTVERVPTAVRSVLRIEVVVVDDAGAVRWETP